MNGDVRYGGGSVMTWRMWLMVEAAKPPTKIQSIIPDSSSIANTVAE